MKLAACLVTCGRHDLTRRTLESFALHNELTDQRLVLLQADEPSMGPESGDLGYRAGFRMVAAPAVRGSQMAALRALVRAAAEENATHVLWMENDWASVKAIPWDVLELPDTVRLFGTHKRLDGHPTRSLAGPHLLGTKTKIRWRPSESRPGWECGRASWAAGGSIIRTDLLMAHLDAPRLKQVMLDLGPILTRRPAGLENIMVSIGDETTPGFLD